MPHRARLLVPLLLPLACAPADEQAGSWDSTASPAPVVTACVRDSTPRHEDPVALVDEWMRREAEGPFEREDLHVAWAAGATTCDVRPDTAPRARVAWVRVRPGRLTSDRAEVVVERAPAGGGTGAASATRLDTVLVVRTRHGWRIARLPEGAYRPPGASRGPR